MVIALILLAVLFMFGLISTTHCIDGKKVKAWIFAPSEVTQKVKLIDQDHQVQVIEKVVESKDELKKKRIFSTFDRDGDGFITREELKEAMKGVGVVMSDSEIDEMVEKMDGNGDGLSELSEFCEGFEMGGGEEDEGVLKEAFDVFDGNRDGVITVEELGKVVGSLGLKNGLKMEDFEEMIRKVDADGDGRIDFEEFKKMLRSGGSLLGSSFSSST